MIRLNEGSKAWMADWLLFFYEFMTATLLRVLQLSIPDIHTAQLMSLFGGLVEVCVRIFFFSNFVQVGMRTNHKAMSKERKIKYALWGRMRVADANNDMVVEYLSSFVAAFFMIYLQPTGTFDFASGDQTVDQSTVLILLMYQLIPELFLDFYVTVMEVKGGLLKVHQVAWSWTDGRKLGSKFFVDQFGNQVKAVLLKSFTSIVLIAFVLLTTVK